MTIEEYAAFLALRENCLRDVAQLKRDIERRFDAIAHRDDEPARTEQHRFYIEDEAK